MPEATEEGLYRGWAEGLERGEVRITRCAGCARWQWYPTLWCRACGAEEWDWVPVNPVGVLVSWTEAVRPTVPFPDVDLPYTVAVVELPQAGGARVLALATDAGPLDIGAEVALECRPLGSRAALHVRSTST